MSHIMYAWEIGTDLGHAIGFLPVARELRQRGHVVTFALSDVMRADAMLAREGFRLIQAPFFHPLQASAKDLVDHFGQVLQLNGFFATGPLLGVVKAWRHLWSLEKPDLLITEFAPTALLAARGYGIPVAGFGNGFTQPPAITPLPPFGNQEVPSHSNAAHEAPVIATCNGILSYFEQAPIRSLAELLRTDASLLTTYPELDHYRQRGPAEYFGPTLQLDGGELPPWPSVSGPKVFAYLKSNYPALEHCLQALSRLRAATLVYCADLPPALLARYTSPRLAFTNRPLRYDTTLNDAAMVVSHGGHGTVAAALLAGRPLFILPSQVEQSMLAMRVQAMGAGIASPASNGADNMLHWMSRLLEQSRWRQSARTFAKKYREQSQSVIASNLANRCEALIVNH